MDDATLPPGEHAHDPADRDLDPILWQVERIMTHVHWVDEHHSTFMQHAGVQAYFTESTDAKGLRQELANLQDSLRRSHDHVHRLAQLVLAGYTVNPEKRVPPTLPVEVQRRMEWKGY